MGAMFREQELNVVETTGKVSSTHWAGSLLAAAVCLVGAGFVRADDTLRGTVEVDGSSTVAPISMAAAELFQAAHAGVGVTVGVSGTGGGFKKFLAARADLRTDINGASRPISEEEIDRARRLGVAFIEIPVAVDGMAVTVHAKNDFCSYLTVEELRRIWKPGSEVQRWSDIRGGFPDVRLKLYGPDTDSGTFDYFTEVVVGDSGASRSDYTASASDNVLVMGIAGDRGALGYFGYSYYAANKAKLKLVGIDDGSGQPVEPSMATIRDGRYRPLSRPLFLYVNAESAQRAEVRAFVLFVLDKGAEIVEHPRVNYVALSEEVYSLAKQRLDARRTGSAMAQSKDGDSLSDVFRSR